MPIYYLVSLLRLLWIWGILWRMVWRRVLNWNVYAFPSTDAPDSLSSSSAFFCSWFKHLQSLVFFKEWSSTVHSQTFLPQTVYHLCALRQNLFTCMFAEINRRVDQREVVGHKRHYLSSNICAILSRTPDPRTVNKSIRCEQCLSYLHLKDLSRWL